MLRLPNPYQLWRRPATGRMPAVLTAVVMAAALLAAAPGARGADIACEEGTQDSGSIWRICTPPAGAGNGRLVVWAHGFQDAGRPVGIPEEQLQLGEIYLPELVVGLGFAFATNSYAKTGLAVVEGASDILDLVEIYAARHGAPQAVYLVGASEGGLITALLVEGNPEVFRAGYALCGPVGDFPYQINYLGDARVTFEYFFPQVVPGHGYFNDIDTPIDDWPAWFDAHVAPLAARHPSRWRQWVRVARLPFDEGDFAATTLVAARDALRYTAVNLLDAVETLGGFPYENRWRWYSGSRNDWRLNLGVKRFAADPAAVAEMRAFYNTTGRLDSPLVTMHTLRDPQVPYAHELIYNLKTLGAGRLFTEHLNLPVDRFGHCRFTPEEGLAGFALMLLYAGDLEVLQGVGAALGGQALAAFETIARREGIPYRVEGERLEALLK